MRDRDRIRRHIRTLADIRRLQRKLDRLAKRLGDQPLMLRFRSSEVLQTRPPWEGGS